MSTRAPNGRPLLLLAAACLLLSALAPPAAAEEAAIGATITIEQTALSATLYNAPGDVRVALSGTVHIASDRGHWVRLELSIGGTGWARSLSPASVQRQTDAEVPFTGWVEVPRSAPEGTYSLHVQGHDGDSLFPIDTQAAFTISVFRGPLALAARLDTPLPGQGETAAWTLTLRNLASFDLDFEAAFAGPSGFQIRAEYPPVQIIAPAGEETVLLSLTAPVSAAPGDYEWSVSVTSNSHPEVSATLAAPFAVTRPLPPAPGGASDLFAQYWLPITLGLAAAGAVVFFSFTEVGYLALAFSLLMPLFTRIRRDKVLDNFTRGQIFGYIQANPGAHYSAIAQVLSIENGVLAYHLRVLLRENYLVARNEGIFKRFYPRDYRIPTRRTLLTRLQVDILEHIEKSPGLSQRDLAGALGESKQVISYNVGVLRDAGLLEAERRGRDVILRTLEGGARAIDPSEDEGAQAAQGPSDLSSL